MLVNLFKKEIPKSLPAGVEKAVASLQRSKTKEECLEKTYSFLATKYRGYRIQTYLRMPILLTNTLESIWQKRGFLHCSNMNYLIRVFLVRSGHFQEEDIQHRFTTIWLFSPHQYLNVKLGENRYIDVDLWGKAYGIPLGDYARGFNTYLWARNGSTEAKQSLPPRGR